MSLLLPCPGCGENRRADEATTSVASARATALRGLLRDRLTGEQLRACENAVSFAGYPYFADQGTEFVNELLETLARLRSLAGVGGGE